MPEPMQEDENYFDNDDYFTGSGSNYDRLPGGYRFLRRGMFWKGKINRIKKYKQSGHVLDIGCAYGFLLYFMRDRYDVHGCDISPHAIETCRKIFKDTEKKKFFVQD
nr:class I SAM-dependent methyltransferase [Candidatus Sigynarchaeota archaeon]